MFWLLDHYVLHVVFVLAVLIWGIRFEAKSKEADARLRVLVRMIDRDFDDIRTRQDGQDARTDEVLEEIRAGVKTLLDHERT